MPSRTCKTVKNWQHLVNFWKHETLLRMAEKVMVTGKVSDESPARTVPKNLRKPNKTCHCESGVPLVRAKRSGLPAQSWLSSRHLPAT